MRRRKAERTLLLTQGIFNLLHHIGMVCMRGIGLWWCSKLYTSGKWIAAQLNVIVVTRIRTLPPRVNLSHALTNWAISPPNICYTNIMLYYVIMILSSNNVLKPINVTFMSSPSPQRWGPEIDFTKPLLVRQSHTWEQTEWSLIKVYIAEETTQH